MEGYDASTYGERWAEIYDEWVERAAPVWDAQLVVPVLAELAGPGPVLELAIGTGRIALPLAATGVEVHGIDASEAMVARLREKPGGAAIPVTMGDFGDVAVEGRYRLIFVVFNTFFALPTQEDQVRCFTNVAEHLTEDGVFVIEAFFPDVARFDRGQRVEAREVGVDGFVFHVSRHDPLEQRVDSMQVEVGDGRVRTFPVRVRYAWPSELDLMARLAGLRLRERWGGWEGEPFTAASFRHVSIYEKAQ